MKEEDDKHKSAGNFYLNKWFLDFIADDGETMIFYSAQLKWYGLSVSYTSWIHYDLSSGTHVKSRFHNVETPFLDGNVITWEDKKFGVSGTWESLSECLQARIFDSPEGSLEWECFQPASRVTLKFKDRIITGKGYVEQLILTTLPWKIPMDQLRWGRFGSAENTIVWIELKGEETKQWLWLNGGKVENCSILDNQISMPGKELTLNLDRGVVLESEKKIFQVVRKLIRYLPGFGKTVPMNFLMADEYKWLSKAQLHSNSVKMENGMAIHELVNFNPVT